MIKGKGKDKNFSKRMYHGKPGDNTGKSSKNLSVIQCYWRGKYGH
jgi:hypothetical protein